MSHEGKIAIVCHDIGKGIAQAIAKMGDDVVLISPEEAKTKFPLIYHHGIDERTNLSTPLVPPIPMAKPEPLINRTRSKHHNSKVKKRKKPGKKTHRKK